MTTENQSIAQPEIITVESLQQKADAAFNALNDARSKGLPKGEQDKLKMVWFKADDAVNQFIKKQDAEKEQKELEAKLNEHLAIIVNYKDAVLIVAGLERKYPVNKRTPEQLQEINVAYDAEKALYAKLQDELKASFVKGKKVIHLAQGVTGKQLEASQGNGKKESGKQELYEGLMDAGMSNEEIMAQYPESKNDAGTANGTLRTARTAWNKRNGK